MVESSVDDMCNSCKIHSDVQLIVGTIVEGGKGC